MDVDEETPTRISAATPLPFSGPHPLPLPRQARHLYKAGREAGGGENEPRGKGRLRRPSLL
jgi:hypothetical protein